MHPAIPFKHLPNFCRVVSRVRTGARGGVTLSRNNKCMHTIAPTPGLVGFWARFQLATYPIGTISFLRRSSQNLVKCMRSRDLVERIAQFRTKLCDLRSHDFEQNCVNLNPMNLARNYAIWIRAILCAIVLSEAAQFCTKLCELKSHKSKRRIWQINLTLGKTH